MTVDSYKPRHSLGVDVHLSLVPGFGLHRSSGPPDWWNGGNPSEVTMQTLGAPEGRGPRMLGLGVNDDEGNLDLKQLTLQLRRGLEMTSWKKRPRKRPHPESFTDVVHSTDVLKAGSTVW